MFAERLKKIREERGLTQMQLAELMGVAWNSIWRYENTKRKPSYDIIEVIVNKVDVDPRKLFDSRWEAIR
jgi:transcriptional regulator with XRE-family HTH domain